MFGQKFTCFSYITEESRWIFAPTDEGRGRGLQPEPVRRIADRLPFCLCLLANSKSRQAGAGGIGGVDWFWYLIEKPALPVVKNDNFWLIKASSRSRIIGDYLLAGLLIIRTVLPKSRLFRMPDSTLTLAACYSWVIIKSGRSNCSKNNNK
jgi:hypothetical protein